MHKENWDDLRFVLAVADHGSVSAAARVLGVNHATVLRRVAAFEERHQIAVFDKTQQGYAVAADRQHIVDALREVETAALAVRRTTEGLRAPLSGVVRVTSTDTLCRGILPEIVRELQRESSDLRIELISSNAHLDIARLAADIAVRPALELPDDLQGQVVAQLCFAVFAAADAPETWLGLSGNLSRSTAAVWLAQHVPAERLGPSSDSFLTLAQMARAGLGRAILPTFVGVAERDLHRVPTEMPPLPIDIWVANHPDMGAVPRIRAVKQFLIGALEKRRATLCPDGAI